MQTRVAHRLASNVEQLCLRIRGQRLRLTDQVHREGGFSGVRRLLTEHAERLGKIAKRRILTPHRQYALATFQNDRLRLTSDRRDFHTQKLGHLSIVLPHLQPKKKRLYALEERVVDVARDSLAFRARGSTITFVQVAQSHQKDNAQQHECHRRRANLNAHFPVRREECPQSRYSC